jgi:hypothetical protein
MVAQVARWRLLMPDDPAQGQDTMFDPLADARIAFVGAGVMAE